MLERMRHQKKKENKRILKCRVKFNFGIKNIPRFLKSETSSFLESILVNTINRSC